MKAHGMQGRLCLFGTDLILLAAVQVASVRCGGDMVSHAVATHEAGAMLRKTPKHKANPVNNSWIRGVHM